MKHANPDTVRSNSGLKEYLLGLKAVLYAATTTLLLFPAAAIYIDYK